MSTRQSYTVRGQGYPLSAYEKFVGLIRPAGTQHPRSVSRVATAHGESLRCSVIAPAIFGSQFSMLLTNPYIEQVRVEGRPNSPHTLW